MWTRAKESELLQRCAQAGGGGAIARDGVEAVVFDVAALLVQSHHPVAASSLRLAAAQFFDVHPGESRMNALQAVRHGLVPELPRFRHMLERYLAGAKTW